MDATLAAWSESLIRSLCVGSSTYKYVGAHQTNVRASTRQSPEGDLGRLPYTQSIQTGEKDAMSSNDGRPSATIDKLANERTSRRSFLRTASLSAVGAGALAACGKGSAKDTVAATATPAAPAAGSAVAGATGGTMGAHDTTKPAAATSKADQMDAMHEAGIKAFPAKTAMVERSIQILD